MKRVFSLFLALVMLTGLCSLTALGADKPSAEATKAAYEAAKTYFEKAGSKKNMLSLEEVLAAAEAGDSLLIDIRGAEDYAKGHLKGAVNIPFVQVVNYLDQLPRDKRIIVNCFSGQTAGQIVGSLSLAGFNAYSLSGGAGSVVGTVIGAAIIGVLRNALVLLSDDSYWQMLIMGVVIIGAVTLDQLRHAKK